MLTMTMRNARTSDEAVIEKLGSALEILSARFNPVIRPAIEAQASALELPREALELTGGEALRAIYSPSTMPIVKAEIFFHDHHLVAVMLKHDQDSGIRRIRRKGEWTIETVAPGYLLQIRSIGPTSESVLLAEVDQEITKQTGLRLKPFHRRSDRFDELLAEGRSCPSRPTAEEVAAARLLADKAVRALAVAIKSSGGLLNSDLPKPLASKARPRVDQIRSDLLASGLVEQEVVVVCKKSGIQVNRLPSMDLIPELDSKGVRCSCGRNLAEESAEEALRISDQGRVLLDGSRWLTVLLISELLDLGVPIEDILVEESIGGDEMDAIALLSGNLVFFELKDKEFNLGNAYSFGAKLSILRPDVSVILTTDKVGADAREHFQRASAAGTERRRGGSSADNRSDIPVYIEGVDAMRAGLDQIITEVTVGDASRALRDVLQMAAVGPLSLLNVLRQSGS